MSTGLAIRLLIEPQRVVSAATIAASAGSYVGIGTPAANPVRQFLVQNLTDVTLQFSIDGVNNHFPLASNTSFISDIASNKTVTEALYIAVGTRFYVTTIGTPSTGNVYVTYFYGGNG
jgi:hypothetical protein